MKSEKLVSLSSIGVLDIHDAELLDQVSAAASWEEPATDNGTNVVCHTENVGCSSPNVMCESNVVCGT